MLITLIVLFLTIAALGLAVKLLRGSAPEEQVQRRLKIVQQAEFAPAYFETTTDVRKQEQLSPFPWLSSLLAGLHLTTRFRLLLQQADIEWTVGSLLMVSLFSWIGTGCLLYLRIWSLWPAVGLSALVAPLPFLYVLRQRRRRFAKFEEQLPEAIDMLVSALRAGHSLMTAIGFIGQEPREPLSSEFRICFDEQNYGIDLRTALTNMGTRMAVDDLQIFIPAFNRFADRLAEHETTMAGRRRVLNDIDGKRNNTAGPGFRLSEHQGHRCRQPVIDLHLIDDGDVELVEHE